MAGGYGGGGGADREAMLRQFAPAATISQDGQIGVDRDTMMMWSAMPSTFETQDWETYLSSMLGIGAVAAPAVPAHDDRGAAAAATTATTAVVDGMGRFL